VKTALKGKRFQDTEEKHDGRSERYSLNAAAECFQKLFKRQNKCIQVGED
jgi:hypothetical protein